MLAPSSVDPEKLQLLLRWYTKSAANLLAVISLAASEHRTLHQYSDREINLPDLQPNSRKGQFVTHQYLYSDGSAHRYLVPW
jgi:hypothetical protein